MTNNISNLVARDYQLCSEYVIIRLCWKNWVFQMRFIERSNVEVTGFFRTGGLRKSREKLLQ